MVRFISEVESLTNYCLVNNLSQSQIQGAAVNVWYLLPNYADGNQVTVKFAVEVKGGYKIFECDDAVESEYVPEKMQRRIINIDDIISNNINEMIALANN